ncbi:MAG: hypothetical protein EBX41_06125 [Chitinophagia bacterium]|nr:hypothetical protein [Chitinophagia bacterium]
MVNPPICKVSDCLAVLSFAIAGGAMGLLFYNYAPAKIYMGDTGSMLAGFTLFMLSLLYLRYGIVNAKQASPTGNVINSYVQWQVVVAMLFPPVFDALRVVLIRMRHGRSPLKADRLHLHYLLLDKGMSHATAAWLIVATHLLTMGLGIALNYFSFAVALLPIVALPSVLLAFWAGRE